MSITFMLVKETLRKMNMEIERFEDKVEELESVIRGLTDHIERLENKVRELENKGE